MLQLLASSWNSARSAAAAAVVAALEPAAVVVVERFTEQQKKTFRFQFTALQHLLVRNKEELSSSDPDPELEFEQASRLRNIWRRFKSCTFNIPQMNWEDAAAVLNIEVYTGG